MTRLAEERGWTRRWDQERALAAAREVLGPILSRHAQPVEVRGDAVLIEVDHPVWGQEILLNKSLLLERINALVGKQVAGDLRVRRRRGQRRRDRVAPADGSQRAAPAARPGPTPHLPPGAERALAALTEPVADPRLREAWCRFVRRVWSLQAQEAETRVRKGGGAGAAG